MNQILDSAGNPIKQSGANDAIPRYAKSAYALVALTLAGIAALALLATNLKTIRDVVREIFYPDPAAVFSKMTKAELDRIPTRYTYSHAKNPVKVSGLIFHDAEKKLDLRLTNTTDQDVVINKIVITLYYQYNYGGKIPVADGVDLGISPGDVRRAKAAKKPFAFKTGINAAYELAPRSSESYLFIMNISASDLYVPPDAPEGSHYNLAIYLDVDDDEISTVDRRIGISDGQLYIADKQ